MASASEERWQTNRSTVLERNKYMFNNPVMSDIKFVFPNKQTIPAHKYVLAISSPVFFAMFYGDLAEKRETIDITDCDPDIFLQFLRYLYYDDANFRDVNSAIQVWYLADKYDVPSLARECVGFVQAAMNPVNAFDVISIARRFNHKDLEKTCWEVIDYNAQQIVTAKSFLELKPEFLLSFVERTSLRIDEVSLFEALDRWAARRCKEANMTIDGANKRSVLGEELLKNVRFSLMSPQKFSNVVMPTEILFTTEVIDVFKQFSRVRIPGGLKFSIIPRIKNEANHHSLSMGNITGSMGAKNSSGIESMPKVGMLTFMVSKSIALCGVKIITDSRPSRFSLSLFRLSRGGKPIAQIENRNFTANRSSTRSYSGGIDVFFNRPLRLTKNTCYNIETKTDSTQNQELFVWSMHRKTSFSDTDILKCSGHYTECIPTNVGYKGEIMGLLCHQELNDSDSSD